MTNDLISREAAKTDVAGFNPEIVVEGTKDKPYFVIKYFDKKEQCHMIGFGSYYLNLVFDWLKEYFGYERANANDAVPVVRGEWMLRHVGHGHYWECSVCHANPCYVTEHTNFCQNCGAAMTDEAIEIIKKRNGERKEDKQ